MGIQGLLPLLKSIMVPVHIKDLHGCCVAVDTYSWLHKGALSCSKDLCKGLPTSKHIDYCMHRVNLLRHHGVKPILVFDGGLLPMKGEQENKRARSRKENLARACEHESCGNASAAFECYQKAVDISPSIAYELIQVLKQENILYVVAPYEADAQMTFLVVSKRADAVITEDSDLIPFGCSRIIYKMDKFGQGVQFQYSTLQCNKELSFTGFTKQMFLEMCILSGCDYLQSLPGMGLKKAHALIKKFKSYDKVIKHLKYSDIVVLPLYEESFRKAIMTFQHQRVYDPVTEDIVHLSDLPDNVDKDLDFLGPLIPQHIAKGIAKGDIDPFTQLPIQGDCVGAGQLLDGTKLKSFKPGDESKKIDLPAQKNLLTNYFCFTSLEAKRKFRAPRISAKHPNPTTDILPPREDVCKEADSCKINCCLASMSDIGNIGVMVPAEDPVDNAIAKKASVLLESLCHDDMRNPQQSRHSIHPCIALQKEREYNSALDAVEGKTRIEKKNVIVRSSYFKNKSTKETGQENKNENLLVKDTTSTAACPSNIPCCELKSGLEVDDGKNREENKNDIESSFLQHEYMKGNDQEIKSKKLLVSEVSVTAVNETTIPECESMPALDAVEGKTKVENRKPIVSRYFKHKSFTKNDQENMHEKLTGKCIETDSCENTIKECSLGNNYNEGSIMKRKVPLVDSSHEVNSCTSDLDDSMIETRGEERKFGCNISHLGEYSDMDEKSMEKIVAVISSFKCSSSGSCASGLRAPLKDVRNTCTNRPSNSMDLSKFSYAPTKHKASLASHKC